MTKITQRTEIQIETHDVTIIRTKGQRFSVYCQQCKRDISTFTPEQVTNWRQLIDSGETGSVETGVEAPVCGNSI